MATNHATVEKQRLVEELHAPARRNFPRRRVIVRKYDDLWQADVVEMRPYSRLNRGYHYILTVIDVLSKYAWAIPLKNLQTLINKHSINHYSTYSVMKALIVERFNRTLKNDMWKQFTLNGSYKWIDILPRLLMEYNARKHRTIGMRPIDVTPAIADKLLTTVYSNVKVAGPARFKVGDPVRVSKFKTLFDKVYTPNWTTEVFNISKIQTTYPVTYLLEDSRRQFVAEGFYEHELHRVANPEVYLVEKVLRKKGDKVYVKWLGLDKSHNSWINKTNVL
ncbi:uncharacterized protein LOC109861215 [Pseudomyrmex gracilis]|uniref:uncharacterized protein LOC109861215 n=1 Tax=Pseudomyrmex gracilis TaxID=219809 RepID=UPI000994EE51|nr:uncharacterized protein LOC109861215 [Pseudomyrmex gracilis]